MRSALFVILNLRTCEFRNKIARNFEFRKLKRNDTGLFKLLQPPMDELDEAILTFLQRDGRMRFTQIASELNVAEGTVRNRVAKLLESNVVQIVGLIDPHRVGFEAPAIVGVNIVPPFLETAAARIAELEEVSYLVMVAGEFSLIVEVLCRDKEHLASFLTEKLQKIEGVTSTKTFMILHTFKAAHGATPNFSSRAFSVNS